MNNMYFVLLFQILWICFFKEKLLWYPCISLILQDGYNILYTFFIMFFLLKVYNLLYILLIYNIFCLKVIFPPDGYLKVVRDIGSKYNVLMIADEIQTGLARTGKMLACEWEVDSWLQLFFRYQWHSKSLTSYLIL